MLDFGDMTEGSRNRAADHNDADRNEFCRCEWCGWLAPTYTALVEHIVTSSGHRPA